MAVSYTHLVYARGYVGDASGEYNGVVTGQNLKDDRTPEESSRCTFREELQPPTVIILMAVSYTHLCWAVRNGTVISSLSRTPSSTTR